MAWTVLSLRSRNTVNYTVLHLLSECRLFPWEKVHLKMRYLRKGLLLSWLLYLNNQNVNFCGGNRLA